MESRKSLFVNGIVLVLFLVGLLMACNKPLAPRNNEITKIEIATGGCFGPCQFTATSIDSSLSFKFYGGKLLQGNKRKVIKGYYSGTISKQTWDTLNMKLEAIHYKKLASHYDHSADDQSLELIIYYQGKVKRITAQDRSLPDSVNKVFYWLADKYKSVKITPTKAPIRFDVTLQYLSVGGIKFLPPTKQIK
jgi:hypothetical protein